MEIRIATNNEHIDLSLDMMPDEVKAIDSGKIKKYIQNAYDEGTRIFKAHPEFVQVTFNTITDEEQAMVDEAERKGAMLC